MAYFKVYETVSNALVAEDIHDLKTAKHIADTWPKHCNVEKVEMVYTTVTLGEALTTFSRITK